VVIVNLKPLFARTYFPGENPIGNATCSRRPFQGGSGDRSCVVGHVSSVGLDVRRKITIQGTVLTPPFICKYSRTTSFASGFYGVAVVLLRSKGDIPLL